MIVCHSRDLVYQLMVALSNYQQVLLQISFNLHMTGITYILIHTYIIETDSCIDIRNLIRHDHIIH